MQEVIAPSDFNSVPRRSKRLQNYMSSEYDRIENQSSLLMIKKPRSAVHIENEFDAIADKENFHRVKQLAPRARSAKVLLDLVIDLPTDASDFELSDSECASPTTRVGFLFHQLSSRIQDSKSDRYNFKVYEDPQ